MGMDIFLITEEEDIKLDIQVERTANTNIGNVRKKIKQKLNLSDTDFHFVVNGGPIDDNVLISEHAGFVKGTQLHVCFAETLEKSVADRIIVNLKAEKLHKKTLIEQKQLRQEIIIEKAKINKTDICQNLEEYTSNLNKFIAWIKNIFSIGRFALGLKKQQFAEELKIKLVNTENASNLIREYQHKNELAVKEEFWDHSCLFAKRYVTLENATLKNETFAYEKGELGKILNDALQQLQRH